VQLDFNSGVLAIAAIGGLAAMLISGFKIFRNKAPSRGATALWILVGLFGVALIVWTVNRVYSAAEARLGSTSGAGTAAGETASSAHPDLVFIATSALLACVTPSEPTELPDGANASIEQMRTARTTIIAYDAATTTYTNCVDSTVNDITQRYQGVASASNLEAVKSLAVKMHNEAVEKDQAVAERMNQQIRIFKAKHGP
jgi:hypothetical protein